MAGTRNPTWEPDELILALDVYFEFRPKLPPNKHHPRVVELSNELNSLPIFSPEQRAEKFRNPSGAYLKLANFRAIDPDVDGGMASVGQRDRAIWNEYAGDRQRLRETAVAIRRNITDSNAEIPAEPEQWLSEVTEGKVLLRVHASRERNRAIVQSKKASVLAKTGTLTCEACGFDFRAVYGDLGDGFIECHHTAPVAKLQPGQTTKASELALLCANCHRMIHRDPGITSIDRLRSVIKAAYGYWPPFEHRSR